LATPDELIDTALKGGLIGVLASLSFFLAGIFVQNWNKKKDSKERLAQVCDTLLLEAKDLDDWYKSEGYKELKKSYYEHGMITAAPFENMISSYKKSELLSPLELLTLSKP
jgi:hypothetical protein